MQKATCLRQHISSRGPLYVNITKIIDFRTCIHNNNVVMAGTCVACGFIDLYIFFCCLIRMIFFLWVLLGKLIFFFVSFFPFFIIFMTCEKRIFFLLIKSSCGAHKPLLSLSCAVRAHVRALKGLKFFFYPQSSVIEC